MRTAEQLLTQYAAYHRDRRNISTHFVGVPMIVFSVVLGLAQITIGMVHLGWVAVLAASAYYVFLDRQMGMLMFGFLVLCGAIASLISAVTSWTVGLAVAVLLFAVGWAIQFVGHRYEGVKPAFVDDLIGLAIGPLFVLTEVLFLLGLRHDLQSYIEARVGPVMAERNGRLLAPGSISSTTATATSSKV